MRQRKGESEESHDTDSCRQRTFLFLLSFLICIQRANFIENKSNSEATLAKPEQK